MAYKTRDELLKENRERAITARSARNRRGHAGKRGAVRLPSDNLTKKQLEAKNGECKSYRMNDPMTWEQFKELPDDLKVCYIKAIRNKYGTPDSMLACAMGVQAATFSKLMRELGIGLGRGAGAKNIKWHETGDAHNFNLWWYKKKVSTYGGNLEIEGNVEEDLKKLLEIVKGRNVKLKVSWEVVED